MYCRSDGATLSRPSAAARDALEIELDTWEAAATVPLRPVPRRWPLADAAIVPAVDPATWLLHVRWFRRRRPEVRDALVREYEAPTRHLARRFFRHREPLDDLTQVALEALLVALDRFDPRRRIPFLGFATPTIVGALKRHYRDAGWGIRVPRRAHELAGAFGPAFEALQQDLGRPPTADELADFLDVTPADVEEALLATSARNSSSLEWPDPADGSRSVLAIDDQGFRRAEDRMAVDQALTLLDEQDRQILHRYFLLEMSQEQIAAELGVSQMQVSRLLNRILRRLRAHLPA